MIRSLFRLVLLICMAPAWTLIQNAPSAHAQSTKSKFTMQGVADTSESPVIRDGANRPCLNVEAAAKGHVQNGELMDHIVSVKNNCSRMIRVKICYYHSDHCKDATVYGYQRVDTILGTMKMSTFRYSLFQK
ncbi:hypothetical protein ABIG06_004209 [Bradyrhizobium sp. USDA 326]|uniref:hypothetical protein n=1 Tax=unclassified Bradyrhizobium TaxID=2631580 RepID=UPI0035145651